MFDYSTRSRAMAGYFTKHTIFVFLTFLVPLYEEKISIIARA